MNSREAWLAGRDAAAAVLGGSCLAEYIRALPPPPDLAQAEPDARDGEIERLRNTMMLAACQFSKYERQHRVKGTLDADAKANTNRRFAEMCWAAISPPPPPADDAGGRG